MRFSGIFIILPLVISGTLCSDLPENSKCSRAGFMINFSRGRVTSPNYPRNYPAHQDCKWNLLSAAGIGIRLVIEHLDNKEIFPNGNGVCYDKLRILSGTVGGVFTYIDNDELCAKNADELRRTTLEIPNPGPGSVVAQITFKSDYAEHFTGFSIHYEALCNKTQTGQSGTFSSPNYPNKYPNYVNCFTEIRADPGTNIEITFSKVDVENQSECQTDYIVVTKGIPGLPGGAPVRYCRPDIGTITIKSNVVTVQFVTDGNIIHSGFEASWKAVSPPTISPTISNAVTTVKPKTVLTTKTVMTTNCTYTNESILCQRWDAEFPHKPKYQPIDSSNNYCSNPDDDNRGVWCYTTDPNRRWGYCDLDNCVGPTEASTIVTTTTDSESTTNQLGTVSAMLEGGVSPEKQTSSSEDEQNWYLYLLIPIGLLLLIIFAAILVWRWRRRNGAIKVNDPAADDAVRFSQLEREDDPSRPRENTYVEIPFIGKIQHGNAERNLGNGPKSANGFVSLDTKGSKNSSFSSHDSIKMVKEAAKRNFVSVNMAATTSRNEGGAAGGNATAMHEDSKNPYNMADDCKEENLYQTIAAEQENKARQKFDDDFVPPLPRVPSEGRSIRSDSGKKKKEKTKKETKKKLKKKISVSSLGFGNPSYQEKEYPKDDSATENPFDSEDEERLALPPAAMAGGLSEQHQAPGIKRNPDDYRANDSPYMAPRLPSPNKNKMVCISPDIIDDKVDDGSTLYSTPNPTSPIFELPGNFIYDIPSQARARDESTSSDSGQPKSTKTPPSGSSPKTGRDSGNSSLSALDLMEADENRDYCIMNSVPRKKRASGRSVTEGSEDKSKEIPEKDIADNRLSHMYVSMQGTKDERRESETMPKKHYENLSQPRMSV